MTKTESLVPASELAKHGQRYPNESDAYRRARTALLAEEIELRRHIERVAEQRRALPLGGVVPEDYVFQGARGPVTMSQLFGPHQSLVTYNFMYGPQDKRPCPMCAALLASWDGEAPDLEQRVGLAVIGKSPVDRLLAFKKERGWQHLKFYSSAGNSFNRDYFGEDADGAQQPAMNVFTRRDGKIHHFWGGEMYATTPDPGQDPRGAPDMVPLWTILDTTPEGRGRDWYPKLDYAA